MLLGRDSHQCPVTSPILFIGHWIVRTMMRLQVYIQKVLLLMMSVNPVNIYLNEITVSSV